MTFEDVSESEPINHPVEVSADSNTHVEERQGIFVLATLCLGFVVLADAIFYDQPRGWTVGLYGSLLMIAILLKERYLPRRRPALLITGGLGVLFLSCLEELSWLTLILGLVGLSSLAITVRNGWIADALVWGERWRAFLVTGWLTPFKDAVTYHRLRRAETSQKGAGLQALRNWLLVVIFAGAFVGLFAMANPIISDWLERIWESFSDLENRLPTEARVSMWAILGIAVWALLRFRVRKEGSLLHRIFSVPQDACHHFDAAIVTKCLLLFNAIFAVQTVLDACYLWGGAQLPKGFTYAQYAHRGVYPLLAAAIVAAFFVLVTFGEDSPMGRKIWNRRLVYAWLAQNVFMVISAGWRLCLYIDAYTLTRWRIAAVILVLLIACGIFWIVFRIGTGRSNLWLINANVVTAIFVLYLCSFANFDGWIADYNVRHCREVQGQGQPIDLGYLRSLGPETLPALMWLDGKLPNSPQTPAVHKTIAQLREELQNDTRNWRGWTYRRHRLKSLDFQQEDVAPSVRH